MYFIWFMGTPEDLSNKWEQYSPLFCSLNTMWKFYEIKYGQFLFISLFVKWAFYMYVYGNWPNRGRYNLYTYADLYLCITKHILTSCKNRPYFFHEMCTVVHSKWFGIFCEKFKSGGSLLFKCPGGGHSSIML